MEEYHGFYHGFWAGFWAEPVGLPRDPMSITVKHQAKQNETQMLSSDFMFFFVLGLSLPEKIFHSAGILLNIYKNTTPS